MNSAKERGDENSNMNSTDCNFVKFRKLLNLDDIKGVKITSIKSTNIIYLSSNTECTQFDVSVTLALDFDVDIKIVYPRIVLFNNKCGDISKLRINIKNHNIKREIISCTNYLQRQRNLNLALITLKRCAIVIAERKLIIDMLVLESEGAIMYKVDEDDGGILISSEDPRTHFKFFESLWRIQFYCSTNFVGDFIDFSITTVDLVFHNTAKPSMNMLIKPNVPYNNKVELWWNIVRALNFSVEEEILEAKQHTFRDFLRVRNIEEINSASPEQLEIIESDDDDDDCVVIDDLQGD